jgi:putative tryptophan/tyrosine transport system substrate-binding protein
MSRRELIPILAGAVAWPFTANALPGTDRPRIGILSTGPAGTYPNAFLQGLHELGYREGQNIDLELRFADWQLDRLERLASELVKLNVAVILARSTPAARAAKQATNTIPIVAVAMGDPVADGLVANLASPGGNVTGNTFLGPELVSKRVQLFRDAVRFSRLAALWHPEAFAEVTTAGFLSQLQSAAQQLGLELQIVEVAAPEKIDVAFAEMVKRRADALIVLPSSMFVGEYRRIVELAASTRIPVMYQGREFVDAGGLMSYGTNFQDLLRRSADYVVRILKGAKPSELPVEQPTRFELVVNLRAANDLGITIPRQFLLSADDVLD